MLRTANALLCRLVCMLLALYYKPSRRKKYSMFLAQLHMASLLRDGAFWSSAYTVSMRYLEQLGVAIRTVLLPQVLE